MTAPLVIVGADARGPGAIADRDPEDTVVDSTPRPPGERSAAPMPKSASTWRSSRRASSCAAPNAARRGHPQKRDLTNMLVINIVGAYEPA